MQRDVAAGTFAFPLLLVALFFPAFSSASSSYDFDSPQNLQVNMSAQANAIDTWLSDSPDETTESQSFADIVRLNVLGAFGFMNASSTQEYESYYKNAVSLYNDADTDFLAAKSAFAQGNYTTAGTKLSESQTELKYASATYESANSIWEGQLIGAQTALSDICTASGDVTGVALGAASGSDVVDDAAEVTMHAVCDAAFGHSGDIKEDSENTIAGTVEDNAMEAFIDSEAPGLGILYSGLEQAETYLGIYNDATKPAPAMPQTAAVVPGQSSKSQSQASLQPSQPHTTAPSSATSANTQPAQPQVSAQPQSSVSAQTASQSGTTNIVSAIIIDSSGDPVSSDYSCIEAWLEDSQGNEYGQYDFTYNTDTGRLAMSSVPNGQYTLHFSDRCEPQPPQTSSQSSQSGGYYTYTIPAIQPQSVQLSGSDVFLGTLTLPMPQAIYNQY